MITVINLLQVRSVKPLLSEVLLARLQETISRGEKVLLLLNRKGGMSTLVCRDCGWAARCPACDLLMRVHFKPEHNLLCHFCETRKAIPEHCPLCHSSHLVESGARVQAVERDLRDILPEATIFLVEDVKKVTKKALAENTIFIGTQKSSTLPIENLGLVVFLLVESDLAVPEYDMEEVLYHQIRYFFNKSANIILQTRSPKLRLIEDITQGNYRQFFRHTTEERKMLQLPPFMQMVLIRIAETSESTLKQRIAKLAAGLIELAKKSEKTTVIYDHLLIEKRAGKYLQKILIRSPDMLTFLEPFRTELIRGRGIQVEWL